MRQIGVLVVDDSSFIRRCISQLIERDPQFTVVGIARNGKDALEKIQRLQPDVVTMDVEMPEMDGIEALTKIMASCPVPVIMLSNHTEDGAKTTIKALELGAVDFYLKNMLVAEDADSDTIAAFFAALKGAAARKQQSVCLLESSDILDSMMNVTYKPQPKLQPKRYDLLLIGCSTGGPGALQTILPRFSAETRVPILVIQHMPQGFTGPLAERFDTICPMRVKEAATGDVLEPGTIYIAPAGFQTYTKRRPDGSVQLLIDSSSPIETVYTPSVDVALLSATQVFRERLLTVIMTGMGKDGLIGCGEAKKNGGYVVVEAEESCIVYGMPRAVFEAGLADRQVPLQEMFDTVNVLL